MNDPYFFGYGSLVNANTHIYDQTHPATVTGWQRCWRHTTLRDLAYLTVEPAQNVQIDGLIAKVPEADWDALDLRETGYTRSALNPNDLRHEAGPVAVQMYQTDPRLTAGPSVKHPVLLSYLDVVVQGFLQVFGEAGVARFFDTTQGWDAPILNDRSNPLYPRHQSLCASETALVDHHLAQLLPHMPKP